MVRLLSVEQRLPYARGAEDDYQKSFTAQQALYRAGLGSLIDAESVRRNAIAAQINVAELELEQVNALIALYRAAGGNWEDGKAASKSEPE